MTKLEELKVAYDAADEVYEAAWNARNDAWVACAAARDADIDAARDAAEDAWAAYQEELKKTQ
jgi:hypothetical protein